MKKSIGNFIVELYGESLMIKNLKGDLLKAEMVKPFESEDKFKEKMTASILDKSIANAGNQ